MEPSKLGWQNECHQSIIRDDLVSSPAIIRLHTLQKASRQRCARRRGHPRLLLLDFQQSKRVRPAWPTRLGGGVAQATYTVEAPGYSCLKTRVKLTCIWIMRQGQLSVITRRTLFVHAVNLAGITMPSVKSIGWRLRLLSAAPVKAAINFLSSPQKYSSRNVGERIRGAEPTSGSIHIFHPRCWGKRRCNGNSQRRLPQIRRLYIESGS